MSSTIQTTLESLAQKFAGDVLATLRTASLQDMLDGEESTPRRHAAPALERAFKASRGRLTRRGPDEILAMVTTITSLLAKNKDGLRAEQIREKLGVDAKELPRPLAEALKQKRITSRGQKRATTYFARAASKPAAPRKKASSKSATKKKTVSKSNKVATKKAAPKKVAAKPVVVPVKK